MENQTVLPNQRSSGRDQVKLRRAFTLSLVLVAIVPLVVVAIAIFQINRNYVNQVVRDELLATADVQDAAVERWADGVVAELIKTRTQQIIYTAIIVIFITAVVVVLIALFLVNRMIDPLKAVTLSPVEDPSGSTDIQSSRFQEIYNQLPTGQCILDTRGKIKEINDTQLRLFGIEKQQNEVINGRDFAEFLDPDSAAYFDTLLSSLTEGKQGHTAELVGVRPDQTSFAMFIATSSVMGVDGPFQEIQVSTFDVSHFRRNDDALKSLISQTNTLYDLGQELLRVESREEIFLTCIDALKNADPERGIAVFMYNQAKGQIVMELAALWNNPAKSWPDVSVGTSFPVEALGIEALLTSGTTIISIDGTQDERFLEPLQQLFTVMQIKSFVGTPIWRRGSVAGFVLIGNESATPFSDAALRLLEGVARQMSVSIENITLLEESQHRANQLEAAAEIAKNTTSEVDLQVLLPQTVDLISDAFGYYHVAVFLADDYRQYAILAAATGAAGESLLKRRFQLPLNDRGMIAACINEGKARIAVDVNKEGIFLSNPLLPDTHSEVTLPLTVRNEVIGALDVQNTIGESFDQSDVVVLQTIADQLANAIYVARLFTRERAATEEIQELHRQYLREKWDVYLEHEGKSEKSIVSVTRENIPDTNIDWFTKTAAEVENIQINGELNQSDLVKNRNDIDEGYASLSSPLTLRGQVIGSIGIMEGQSRGWSDEDVDILSAVSTQAALAIENARLIEETRLRALQLETSAEISQVVTALLDEQLLLNDSVNLIQTRFGFARVIFYCLNIDDEPKRATVYTSGQSDKLNSTPSTSTLIEATSLAGLAISQQAYKVAQDANAPYLASILTKFPETKSALAIPLSVRNVLIGTMEIHSNIDMAFGKDQITVLEILGAQVAISVVNARAYQEQQAIAEKLREVDKLKTQFLANMSHELRTPLNSIIGFSRVILKGIDGPLTEMQKTDLTSIHHSGQHLLGLINDILDLAKIEAGKMDLTFSEVDLVQLVNGISATGAGLVKGKSVIMDKIIPNGLPHITGDETKIRQILLNLVSNAAKFTEEGTITIKATHTDDEVHLSVTDTGMGIPTEKVDTIFDEFTQVDSSTTRKAGGTGLGLSITKKFIELHQGQIQVESQEGVGSTFTVSLPIKQSNLNEQVSDNVDAKSQLKELEALDKPKLLVIDDDAHLNNLYHPVLNTNYEITSLAQDEDIMAKARAIQPHAIIIDVMEPEEDGWAWIQGLKEDAHTAHIPVIICSTVDDASRAESLGVANYLLKPVAPDALLCVLEDVDVRSQGTQRVLIIDDNADDVLLIRRILEAGGHQVIEATNGMDGLDIINRNPPDLLVLDLTMPGLDGFGVMALLKKRARTADIPIIVITARDLTVNETEQINAQAFALLTKGQFSDQEFLCHVDQIFNVEAV